MKKIIISFAVLVLGLSSCADYIDVVPDNVATIDYAFRDRTTTERFLCTCYSHLPGIGATAEDPSLLGSDENWMFINTAVDGFSSSLWPQHQIKIGLQNVDSPIGDCWKGLNNARSLYDGIRYCNIFIENLGDPNKKIVDLTPEERLRWKAEVMVLKAYMHFYLMRMYGPVPLIKENKEVDSTPEEVRVYRDKWDDCIDYVVALIDEAAPNLPLAIEDVTNELGRITRPAALAFKALALVTSASPLFNGNPEYADIEDNRGVRIFTQSYDESKWAKAAQACKEAIEVSHEAGHKLYTFSSPYYILNEELTRINSIRCAYSERYNQEILYCAPRAQTNWNYTYYTKPFLNPKDANNSVNEPMVVPTFRVVEKFYTENGVPMDEDKDFDYDGRYDVVTTPSDRTNILQPGYKTARMHVGREPRFYANIAFDGGYWWGNYYYSGSGAPINTKAGDQQGKNSSFRYTITGYWMKKPSNYLTSTGSNGSGMLYTDYSSPFIRLADLYLLYAEASNEAFGPTEEAYEYLDKVRERAGLKGVVESWSQSSIFPDKPKTKDGLREIIHRERDVELCFEGSHFWDVRRWKTAVSEINGPIYGWTIEASTAEDFYQKQVIDNLRFTTKDYLWPIRSHNLKINTNLIQNPYWE